MCTAIILHGVFPSHPVVVAGNRDEWTERPAVAPHVWTVRGDSRSVRIFAGRDQKEGGTWFGINEHGLAVGITNRYTGVRDAGRASRGQLVLKCLEQDSVETVLAIVHQEEAARYNPFNLFCLSGTAGAVITHDDQRYQTLDLERGVHVLTNRPPDDPRDAKRDWLKSSLRDLPEDPDAVVEPISRVLAIHGQGDFPPPVCVHLPGYGTVSSFLLLLGARKEQSRYLYANGSPCQAAFEDRTPELLTLFCPEP